MNVEFINPFLAAGINVLKTMAFLHPKHGEPFVKKVGEPSLGDISGIVGLTGPVKGSIAVSFSEAAILAIVSNMFSEPVIEINAEVKDAVGELSNMICGDARRILGEKGYAFAAAIPTVVVGKRHEIVHVVPGASIVIPFTVRKDRQETPFFIDACFES